MFPFDVTVIEHTPGIVAVVCDYEAKDALGRAAYEKIPVSQKEPCFD